MILTAALGLAGVACIMLRPVRLIAKQPFAGFGSKAFASLFFCLAGVAAALRRGQLNWQAAALLMGFCLAAVGDVLLAAEPILAHPQRDKDYAFLLGAVPFLLAHGLNLAVLLSRAGTDLLFYALSFVLPALYLVLWRAGVLNFGKNALPLIVYAAVLSAMCAAALRLCLRRAGALGWLALPAVLLLAFSDTALFFFQFGAKKSGADHFRGAFSWLVMFPYYLGQALMACVVMVV
ncbi:MAG: lysoplasmalogenase [Oscillospiraceae bacterium]|jgi:uncharacterized membrane protein YhhN|nr:lysoplasmalogenase [Oscillospiraceae bacterium]